MTRPSSPFGRFLKNLTHALVGLVLVFVWHVPKLVYLGLLVSYAAVFNHGDTFTANPKEHFKAARRNLRCNATLPYAALDLRFALERIVHHELSLASLATRRMRKENDPRKKVSNLRRLDPNSALEHEIWAVNKQTGERYKVGDYKPLDQQRVKQIEGRLGNILHHKPGLLLGIPTDGWYTETRAFLAEALDYLESVYTRNTPFFTFEGIDDVEMLPVEHSDAG